MGKLKNIPRIDFLNFLPTNTIGAEIGVFKGEFSKELISMIKPREIHFIDLWWSEYGEYFPDWGAYTDHGKLKTRDAYSMTETHIQYADYKPEEVKIHVGDDLDILQSFADNTFDWVYLDSSHEYHHTKKELAILENKVKNSGFICGHDWHPKAGQPHHGVYLAINEFCEASNWEVLKTGCYCQWALIYKDNLT